MARATACAADSVVIDFAGLDQVHDIQPAFVYLEDRFHR
jgi:hypothetical protein